MSEQVKGIPEDLREHYEECGKYQNAHLILCRQLIERIARSEQVLAALEGRNAELKAALRRLIGACVRPNGMLQPPDVDSGYAARAAIAEAEKENN